MKLAKIGRSKIEDHYGKVTLSSYASAEVEGTLEELEAFESFAVENEWQEPTCEREEVKENKKGVMIYSDMYDFDADEIKDFKRLYKSFKQSQEV